MEEYIQAGKFKEKCLRIMDEVNSTKREVVITKRHTPIVRVCPIDEEETSLFGKMRGTVQVKGNIIQPIDEAWNADS